MLRMVARFGRLAAALLAFGSTVTVTATAAAAGTATGPGAWGPLMNFGVPGTHMVLMHTGRVLLWRNGDEARVWDPGTGRLTPVADPFPGAANFHCAGQVVLADGRVFAVGGTLTHQHEGIRNTSTFDPATNKWTHTAPMHDPRWYPSVTVLGNGDVLVANGEDAQGNLVPTYEVYRPATNTWTLLAGADRQQDVYAFNALLPNGRVFEASPRPTTWTLDLTSRRWGAGPVTGWRTSPFTESDAIYAPGKILRAGGTTIPDLVASQGATNRAMTIDTNAPTPTWHDTSPMAFARRRLNLVILADGQVMAVGGTAVADDPAKAALAGEIWNPATGRWTTVASMSAPRMYHSAALLLPDGRVLAAGGEPSSAGSVTPPTAQVYSPPYLFAGRRPTIAAAPTASRYGASFSVTTPDAAAITSVALIRPGAVTHAYNMDQRYVPLAFSHQGGRLAVTAPANGNIAPPGFYMLVIKNASGVPSVARWVQLGASAPVAPQAPPPGAKNPATPRVTISTRGRLAVRTIRRRGLAIMLQLSGATRVVRLRLYRRVSATKRRLILTAYRSTKGRQMLHLTLRSRRVRTLPPGRYELRVAAGTSPRRLQATATSRLSIVR